MISELWSPIDSELNAAPNLPRAATSHAPAIAPGQAYIGSVFQQGPGYPGGPGDHRGTSGYAPGMSFGAGSPPSQGASGVAQQKARIVVLPYLADPLGLNTSASPVPPLAYPVA